jgi:cytochrome c peroxidase
LPAPAIERRRFLPGSTDWSPGEAGAPDLAASPLFDGWIVFDGAPALQPAGDSPPRSTESRVGEALFFTTLMSPWNRSDGNLSRFTCETCHFEAYGDGRVHFTGRGTVHASTKPLRGLFNNRPHFTRALDRSMAQMVHAEFRVANRWNGRDPWFALAAGDVPWLASIEGAPPSMSALYLRRALMSFLMELTFEPNQVVRGRRRFSARERAGAELFRRRCESCHGARLVAEEPSTAVPFESWEPLVFSPQGPIVWASAGYRKTGVEPYPHPQGARTTSLRRVHHKFPHFTSGSARSLADVVERAAWVGDRFLHEGAPDDAERLQPDQRASLLAFLELL